MLSKTYSKVIAYIALTLAFISL